MNQAFKAVILMADNTDSTVDVVGFNGQMAVCTPQGPVLITKQQAMDFFGLIDIDPRFAAAHFMEGRDLHA